MRSQRREAAGAEGVGFGLEHGAVLEELAVAAGQLEEIGGEVVGAVVGDDAVEGFGELEQGEGEGAFLGRGQARIGCRDVGCADCGLTSTPRFLEDAPHAGVAVLHVGGRVAGHGEHLVVAEDVVAGAVVGEVGVLDRADADPLGDCAGGRRRRAAARGGRRRFRRRSRRPARPLRPSRPARPTVVPLRVLNGRPSSPSTVPKVMCWSSTSS